MNLFNLNLGFNWEGQIHVVFLLGIDTILKKIKACSTYLIKLMNLMFCINQRYGG